MITARDVLAALRKGGAVHWSRISAGQDPLNGLIRAPLVVWRFANPDSRIRERITEFVESLDGNVEWDFDPSGKNWVLAPRLVLDKFAAGDPADPDVLFDIAQADQNFCVAADEDLARLVAMIEAS